MKRKGIRGAGAAATGSRFGSVFQPCATFFYQGGTRNDFSEYRGTRLKRKVPALYSRSLPIFFCLIRLVKRDVLNTKTPASATTGVALPGFSYFTSISTSAAQHTYTRGKVGHSCGIHRAGRRPRGEGIYICRWSAGWLFSTRKLFSGNYYRCRPTICLSPDSMLRVFLARPSRFA